MAAINYSVPIFTIHWFLFTLLHSCFVHLAGKALCAGALSFRELRIYVFIIKITKSKSEQQFSSDPAMLNEEGGSKQIRMLLLKVFFLLVFFFAFLSSLPLSLENLHTRSIKKTGGRKRAGKIPDFSASNIALAAASETTTTQSLTSVGIKKALIS